MEDVRRRIAAWWLGLTVVGVGIIALPDSGDPVITLSDTHGPSAVDLLGILLVLVGTAILYNHLASSRETIIARVGRPMALALGLSWLSAIGFVVVAVAFDLGPWWVIGALDAAVAQAYALAMSAPRPYAT